MTTPRRIPPGLQLTALVLALGRTPADVVLVFAGLSAVALATVIVPADHRSVPQRILLVLSLLLRAEPPPWTEPQPPASARAARKSDPGP